MTWLLVAILVLLVMGTHLGLGVLTAIGQRRHRGGTALLTAGAIVFFPIYWVAWYVQDRKLFADHTTESIRPPRSRGRSGRMQ